MDNYISDFKIGVDCGLVNYYNRYDSILKDIYQFDSIIEKSEDGCLATNLYVAGYSLYQKNKENMAHVKCSKKIYKKVFCEKHYKLATYLSMINHQSEKLFSLCPKMVKIFNNHLGASLAFREYIKKCYSPTSKSRINIFVLYFSLQYDILLRKERNELCYYFTKNDEGHNNAINIREDSLSVIKDYVNLDDISTMSFSKLCQYYDILSKNYWYFKILALDISKKYIQSLQKSKENRIIINILNLIKKINPQCGFIEEVYPTIDDLCKKIIRDNKKFFKDTFGEDVCTHLLKPKKEKEEKISTSPPISYNLLDNVPSDFHDDVDYEELQSYKRNHNPDDLKEARLILSNEKILMELINKFYDKMKAIHELTYKRLLLLESLKDGGEKFSCIYKNAQVLTSNIKSNEYYNVINSVITDIITKNDKSSSGLYLKFLLLEKSIFKLYIYGDAKEFKTMIDCKMDFFNKIKKDNIRKLEYAQVFIHIIDFICQCRDIILCSYDLPIYFDTVYHLKYSEYSYIKKSEMCQQAKNYSLEIKKNVSEYLELCSNILLTYYKTASYINYLKEYTFV